MEFLLIWLLFGIVSAVAAATRGRSAFGWFWLGMLLGPFGFILALLLPAVAPGERQSAFHQEALRRCPFCAEMIKAAAIKCRFCGSELHAAPAPTLAEPSDHSPDWIDRLPPVSGHPRSSRKDPCP